MDHQLSDKKFSIPHAIVVNYEKIHPYLARNMRNEATFCPVVHQPILALAYAPDPA